MSDTLRPPSNNVSDLKQPPEEDSPPLSASVRRGAFWSALSTLTLRSANIFVTAVVAHILAPRDFGIFAVALTAYVITFSLGGTGGVTSCLLRADLDIDSLAPTMVTVSLTTSTIFACAMAVFARNIAGTLGSVNGTGPVRVMAIALFLEGVTAVSWAQLTRDFRQDKVFLANAIGFIPSTIALLLLAKSGSGAMAFAWSRVINQFIMSCVMIASVSKKYRPGIARSALSTLVKFGLPLTGANFINYILLNVDYAFIGHLVGTVALGAYVLAYNVASWPGSLVGGAITNVSMPSFSRVKHDPDLLKSAMARALRAASVILMPICGLMMALARPLVLTLYGAKWAASAEVLSILSLYGAISIICVLFTSMVTSLGKAKFILIIQLLWLGALVPAMALGVHWSGIIGAAVAHIIVIGLLVLPICIFVLRRATGVHFIALGRAILPPLLAASAAALAARGAASQFASPLIQLITGLAAGGLIYLIAAAPQGIALLSQEQATKLRALRLFRLYNTAARLVRLPVSGPEHRGRGGRHRARHAASTRRRGSATATLTLPTASGGPGTDHGRDVAVTGGITGLLRPESQVVPFWPLPELGELLGWCQAPGHVAVRLVIGEGGAGKTRLAIELARELEGDGWQALWVPPGAEPEAIGAARRIMRPAVLLVDYAETRSGILPLLADAAGDLNGPDLRVVLLARSAGEWWHKLINSAGYQLGEMLAAAPPIRLGPVTHGGVQRDMFDAAVTEFAARLGVTRPAAKLTLSDPDAVVLVVHAAALSAVLDHIEPAADEHFRGRADVLESLLRRETRYCAQVAAARGLDLDPSVQRRAVAAACLIGADSESTTAGLLRRLPEFAESAERRGQVARWLHDLYPGQATADHGITEWLGVPRPDRVAEQLIVSELTEQPGLIPALFTGLDESRAKKALTVLGRAALNCPDAVPLLARALAADLEHLAVPALAVAIETNPMIGRLIADTVTAQVIATQALERIAAAIPRRSFALAETAVAVLKRLADESSDGSIERASWLSDLSARLSDLGRREEAHAAIEEIVTIWRGLAKAQADSYLPSSVTSLNNRSLRKRDPRKLSG